MRSGRSLVIGRIGVQELAKLAGQKGVVSVTLIQFKKTGQPLGDPEPYMNRRPSKARLAATRRQQAATDVPFNKAPPLKGSNFEQLRKHSLLDAKSHDFAGVERGLRRRGRDRGRPRRRHRLGAPRPDRHLADVVSGPTGDPGWNGWPKAFEPFGTLQWLFGTRPGRPGPVLVHADHRGDCTPAEHSSAVTFATSTGPSRNFSAPTARTSTPTPSRPSGRSPARSCSAATPTTTCSSCYGERPAFLITTPKTAGVYDTVYVDLDDDHRFADEKPSPSPRPRRIAT